MNSIQAFKNVLLSFVMQSKAFVYLLSNWNDISILRRSSEL